MFFTITIQTYNHAEALARALQSLVGLRCPPDDDYEILVVDNNSSDGTETVIREFHTLLGPRFRSVVESQQGLSHARNRAIAEARGDVICFIDDDAVIDSGWLAGHAEAYRTDERVVAAGGPVDLRWPEGHSRPSWLSADLDGYLSTLDLGTQGLVMEYPCYPRGCNMSVLREMAKRISGFSVHLGRKGSSLISNEEKHFFRKIHEQGERVVYLPQARVHHMIPETRLSRRFFLRRGYAQGISDFLFKWETRRVHASARWCLRQMALGVKLCMEAVLSGVGSLVRGRRRGTAFLASVRTARGIGYTLGAAAALRKGRPAKPAVTAETPAGATTTDSAPDGACTPDAGENERRRNAVP